jgi:hypothetical protein
MKTNHGWPWVLLCLCITTSHITAADALYFWRDDAGRPHYSESPPSDDRSFKKLNPRDLPNIHITPAADNTLYRSSSSGNGDDRRGGAYYQQRSDRNRHSKSECRHYQRKLRRMEHCVRENDCGLTNRELRHQHHHWNVMYHKYCDF